MAVIIIIGIAAALFFVCWRLDVARKQTTLIAYTLMVIMATLFVYNLVALAVGEHHLDNTCWICQSAIGPEYIQVGRHKMHRDCFHSSAEWIEPGSYDEMEDEP